MQQIQRVRTTRCPEAAVNKARGSWSDDDYIAIVGIKSGAIKRLGAILVRREVSTLTNRSDNRPLLVGGSSSCRYGSRWDHQAHREPPLVIIITVSSFQFLATVLLIREASRTQTEN